MKVKMLSTLAGAGVALLIASPASATFTGLNIVQITDWTGGVNGANVQIAFDATGYQTVQIFALFNDPTDNLLVLGSVLGTFTLSASDGFIYQNEFDSVTRNGWDGPGGFTAGGDPTVQYDTHTGIGNNLAPLRFGEADGNPAAQTFGQGLNSNDAGIVVTPSSGDGLAGGGGSVFLMQITWNGTAEMIVNFEISYDLAGDPAAGTIAAFSETVPAIPAPGALALLGLAGLVGRPRRRRA